MTTELIVMYLLFALCLVSVIMLVYNCYLLYKECKRVKSNKKNDDVIGQIVRHKLKK